MAVQASSVRVVVAKVLAVLAGCTYHILCRIIFALLSLVAALLCCTASWMLADCNSLLEPETGGPRGILLGQAVVLGVVLVPVNL